MKKLTLSVLALSLLGASAFAASSGTLTLRGTVAAVNDVVVTPNGDNLLLNITAGETGKLVASVAETSNNLAGYKIFISSPTGGELRNTSDATKKTTYQIKYNGSATAVTPTVSGAQVKNVASLTGLTTANSNVNVVVAAFATAPAGTYEDTLTVSIQAN